MIYFILPAYNEEENITGLLGSIGLAMKGCDATALVVDDGSTDGTAAAAENARCGIPVKVIRHGRNLGLGSAMRTGLESAAGAMKEGDAVVTMDSDNSHPPEIARGMLGLLSGACDVVIASRFCAGGREIGVKWSRKLFSRGIKLILQCFFPYRNVRDYTCGYRAYGSGIVFKLKNRYPQFVSEKGFTVMVELLLKCMFLGAAIEEVPLVLRYDMKKGGSKIKLARTITRYFVLIFKMKFDSIFGD